MAKLLTLVIVLLSLLVSSAYSLPSFFTLSSYAPITATCPSTPLIRSAEGLCAEEYFYQFGRRRIANRAFRRFIERINHGLPKNDTFKYNNTPVIALASSGGRLRGLFSGAGVIQAFDARDSGNGDNGVKYLYQAASYHVALDGGAMLVSALASNDNRTISDLYHNTWSSSFPSPEFLPVNMNKGQVYGQMALRMAAKELNGFPSTLVDGWGMLLSYHLLNMTHGAVHTLSGLTKSPMLRAFRTPYPIITALASALDFDSHDCIITDNRSLQFEFHPYETGTWEAGYRVFTQTAYLGTPLIDGNPLSEDLCVANFDNLGLMLATSGGPLSAACPSMRGTGLFDISWGQPGDDLIGLTSVLHKPSRNDLYAVYPNPFYQSRLAPGLASKENLHLVNGATSGQNIPLWPIIQPEREIDVIIVNDNSANTHDGYPDGTSLYNTWVQSQDAGLKTMPPVPIPATMELLGLNRKPTFFGCQNLHAITIIYLPNRKYVFPSNISSFHLNYSREDVFNMIANGNMVATNGKDKRWPYCLACGLLLRVNKGKLPSGCAGCLQKYCWPKDGPVTNTTWSSDIEDF